MNEVMKKIALLALILLPATSVLSNPVKSFAAQAASSQTYDCGGVSSAIRAAEVRIPQRGGGTLDAKIFAPDSAAQTAPCPLISMLPGGAGISSVEWAARRLAAVGYIVIITKPLSGGSLDSYNTAAISGIDFILSPVNPYLRDTKTDTIGVPGWSLGARALSRTQEEDARIDALVAWDNLAVSETGDAGSPACTNLVATLRTPRVPALGQASETCADGRTPDAKKIAFERWRAGGVPSMQVVFAGATHFFWSAQAPERQHDIAHYYTQAWFDRWLKGDSAATQRLTARTILGTNLDSLLTGAFNSAAFFDGYDCANLRSTCQLARSTPVLLTEQNSRLALALDSVTFVRSPFPLANPRNFSADGRTRIMLFAANADIQAGEGASSVEVLITDSQNRSYTATVEYAGQLPDLSWLNQIIIRLPESLPDNSELGVVLKVRGVASNRAMLNVGTTSINQ